MGGCGTTRTGAWDWAAKCGACLCVSGYTLGRIFFCYSSLFFSSFFFLPLQSEPKEIGYDEKKNGKRKQHGWNPNVRRGRRYLFFLFFSFNFSFFLLLLLLLLLLFSVSSVEYLPTCSHFKVTLFGCQLFAVSFRFFFCFSSRPTKSNRSDRSRQ